MVGYAVKNIDLIEQKYICPQCQLILREPCQSTICAHRLCQSCIEEQQKDVIVCPICNEQISKTNLKPDRGFRNDMKSVNIICVLCDWNGTLKDYQTHLDHEHLKPKCNYCQKQFLNVNDLIYHQKFDCSQVTVDCLLSPFGCHEKIVRKNLSEHLNSEEHQKAIISFIQEYFPQKTNRSNPQFREYINKISDLLINTNRLNESTQQIRSQANEIHSQLLLTTSSFEEFRRENGEQNSLIQNLVEKQDQMRTNVLNLQDKPKQLSSRMNEGIYIFKIDNVTERIAAARSGAEPYIESSTFYSSPTGYNMRIRVYLNGDDSARNTHMSIHFILLRGEYDPILSFPFGYKVVLCLYSQIEGQKHVIHRFQPNVLLEYFKRPQTDMNEPYPISRFVSLEQIQQNDNPFVRENTMFIKAFVDFRVISNELLEQVCNINPMYSPATQQQTISR